MLPLNYHHLFYFWTTAKAGGIGAASRQLHLAQPTLSLQLKQLERAIGSRLLERGRRGVSLTPEGRIAFDYCERIFSQGEELAAALGGLGAERPPNLRLGVAGPVSRHVLLKALDHVHRAAPEVKITLYGGQVEGHRERLARHRLDLVISTVDIASQLGVEYQGRLAGVIPVSFVATPSLAARLPAFPRDLAKAPMLLTPAEHPVRKDVDLFLNRRSISVSVDVELEDTELLRLLALRGQGVAALDALTVREDLAAGRLRRLHKKPLGITQQVWLARGRHPKPNRALQAAIQSLMEGFTIKA